MILNRTIYRSKKIWLYGFDVQSIYSKFTKKKALSLKHFKNDW